jgi:hypothetical protein
VFPGRSTESFIGATSLALVTADRDVIFPTITRQLLPWPPYPGSIRPDRKTLSTRATHAL